VLRWMEEIGVEKKEEKKKTRTKLPCQLPDVWKDTKRDR